MGIYVNSLTNLGQRRRNKKKWRRIGARKIILGKVGLRIRFLVAWMEDGRGEESIREPHTKRRGGQCLSISS